MKKLLIICLLVVGCTDKNLKPRENENYPKYHMDQEVQVISGFYKGKQGKIIGWITCSDRDTHRETVCYGVKTLEGPEIKVNQKDVRPQ